MYGRELARSGVLAYNPGVPATGATSTLWPALLGLLHLALGAGPATVLATKLLGLGLLAAAAFVATRAAAGADFLPALAAVALVVLHPPLLAGSVSGMEVSLTAFGGAALLLALRSGAGAYGVVAALAPLARPELGALGLGLPLVYLVLKVAGYAVASYLLGCKLLRRRVGEGGIPGPMAAGITFVTSFFVIAAIFVAASISTRCRWP